MFVEIDGKKIGRGYAPYIIAELSANHNGSIERAFDTIKAAYEAGASAIKIQTYTADTMTIDCDRADFMIHGGLWDGYKLYDLYKWAETPFEWHKAIFEYAKNLGITIFSTPFDESAVDLLESLGTPAYKIASFEAIDLPLIRYVASKGKPIILSTGMCTEEEISEAVAAAKDGGCKNLVLLHCISSYPAPMNQANLSQMYELGVQFDAIPGLSDHTLGTTASVAAVALGACVIEKHFTLSRTDKGPDSEFSIEPEELKRLCVDAHDAWLAIGKPGFQRQKAEEGNRHFRRSVYFIKDLKAGQVITEQDIRRIRPGFGLAPKYLEAIVGRTVKVDVVAGTATSWELIDG
ncbi:pseudaminic acid synthase [Pseudomonas guariconensis]|uniref:pseudaminic acid synthase n=1 Tax=Pseudomonas guariconensis TaxID=1288410 RepID=UPI0018D8B642|nr:pseudaminic acid synthase [Pseudomonas guariconensis]MBH3359063.1 pseudaminic acid synthase [Pseudomonas guariconensis]MDM9595247.1 pseudaminic acid synthase [Pseudomonas guariconensis]MDM9608076.1 pseudaminic acid synthase [Pseudomonas guariconensis]MDM9613033.1 pseudaminic acid synthase [Pseudomonas guariconensis]